MKKWEYKVVTLATNVIWSAKSYEKAAQEFEMRLNELEKEGRKLVKRADGFFFFRREKDC